MNTEPCFLVIVADDGGFHPDVDDAVLAAAQNGCVTAVSVLANAAGAGRFVTRARERGLGVGLHFNLTGGAPLSAEGRALAREGFAFSGDKRVLWKAASEGRLAPDAVAAEARAQWERLVGWGAAPDHLDGHNHVHRYPGVLEGVLRGISPSTAGGSFVRVPVEPNCPPSVRPGLPGDPLHAAEMGRRVRRAGWRVPDRFVGFRFTTHPTAGVEGHLGPAPTGVTEWMVHPGRGGTTPFRRDLRRQLEFEVLSDPDTPRHLAALGYTLASFGEIP